MSDKNRAPDMFNGREDVENDKGRTAILFMCDDYKNDTLVQIPGQKNDVE